jgi:hypothetical protein
MKNEELGVRDERAPRAAFIILHSSFLIKEYEQTYIKSITT